jgi:hypothetical protein
VPAGVERDSGQARVQPRVVGSFLEAAGIEWAGGGLAEDEAFSAALDLAPGTAASQRPAEPALSQDPNARRRLLRQMLRKLFKKGKIGASHTHQDNVFRGVADHEKGIAKEVMDLLYREGFLMPKPTTTDPHVSLAADRLNEIKAVIAGEIDNARLRRFVGV